MRTICAWCKKVIKDGPETERVSHGMCLECYDEHNKETSAENNVTDFSRLVDASLAYELAREQVDKDLAEAEKVMADLRKAVNL